MTPLDAARRYTVADNWRVIPVPYGKKAPILDGWQNLRLTETDLPQHFNGRAQNIGVLNGAPSGGLTDVDLDAAESVAAGKAILPRSRRIGGRETRPCSHYFYQSPDPPNDASEPFDDPCRTKGAEGWRLVEIRSTGGQTIIPPSTHPNGDRYRWDADGPPARVAFPDLHRAVALTATAALMGRYWPEQGVRHDAALHWSGFLLRGGVALEDVELLIDTAAGIAHDSEAAARVRDARTTAEQIHQGEKVTGGSSLVELLGEDIGPKILARVGHWLAFISSASTLPRVDLEWPARDPLPALPTVSNLPVDMVPEPLRDWVVDVAERLCVPAEMIAVPALVVASAVVGRAVAIRPSRFDDFTVAPNLWGAVVARPGWLKSPALKQVLAPLHRLISVAQTEAEEARTRAEAERDELEARLKALKADLDKHMKHKEPFEDVTRDLADVRQALRACEAGERRYMTQDSTIEKLGELLRDNPRGMLLCRDELAGWLRTLERAGREGEREFYIEAWAGDQGYTFDRIARGTVHIPALTVSILGGIQPGKLRRYIEESEVEGAGADGLLQRFQLIVWPDTLGAWRRVDRWPDSRARRRVFRVFETLDQFTPEHVGAECDAGDEPEQLSLDAKDIPTRDWTKLPFIRFDREAQVLFDVWRDELEARLRDDSLAAYPAFESHLAKYRSLLPSLALLFHLLDIADGAPADPVGLPAAQLAAGWCDYLEQHARKVYAGELDPGRDAAAALAAKIETGAVADGQSVRDIYRNHWSGLGTPERVQAALSVLSTANWLRVVTVQSDGRPSEIVRLHTDFGRQPGG
jgi:Protein of unknown function (DUF3987)/Bifunctional DNA primase/polymerase, N-terminal